MKKLLLILLSAIMAIETPSATPTKKSKKMTKKGNGKSKNKGKLHSKGKYGGKSIPVVSETIAPNKTTTPLSETKLLKIKNDFIEKIQALKLQVTKDKEADKNKNISEEVYLNIINELNSCLGMINYKEESLLSNFKKVNVIIKERSEIINTKKKNLEAEEAKIDLTNDQNKTEIIEFRKAINPLTYNAKIIEPLATFLTVNIDPLLSIDEQAAIKIAISQITAPNKTITPLSETKLLKIKNDFIEKIQALELQVTKDREADKNKNISEEVYLNIINELNSSLEIINYKEESLLSNLKKVNSIIKERSEIINTKKKNLEAEAAKIDFTQLENKSKVAESRKKIKIVSYEIKAIEPLVTFLTVNIDPLLSRYEKEEIKIKQQKQQEETHQKNKELRYKQQEKTYQKNKELRYKQQEEKEKKHRFEKMTTNNKMTQDETKLLIESLNAQLKAAELTLTTNDKTDIENSKTPLSQNAARVKELRKAISDAQKKYSSTKSIIEYSSSKLLSEEEKMEIKEKLKEEENTEDILSLPLTKKKEKLTEYERAIAKIVDKNISKEEAEEYQKIVNTAITNNPFFKKNKITNYFQLHIELQLETITTSEKPNKAIINRTLYIENENNKAQLLKTLEGSTNTNRIPYKEAYTKLISAIKTYNVDADFKTRKGQHLAIYKVITSLENPQITQQTESRLTADELSNKKDGFIKNILHFLTFNKFKKTT